MRLLLALQLALVAPAEAADPPDAAAARATAAALAELEAKDPLAAQAFQEADAARALGDPGRAGEGYARVLERVPDFAPALRRHCLVLQEAGLRDEALDRCRRARALSELPENRVGLAFVLLDLPAGVAASPGDRAEARQLLAEAKAMDPDDPVAARLRCHLAMEEDDLDLLREGLADMERLAPEHVMTAWYGWSLAHREGRWTEALAALDRAEAAGMDPADVRGFRRLTLDARPWTATWGPALAVGGGLGLLSFALGMAAWRRARG